MKDEPICGAKVAYFYTDTHQKDFLCQVGSFYYPPPFRDAVVHSRDHLFILNKEHL